MDCSSPSDSPVHVGSDFDLSPPESAQSNVGVVLIEPINLEDEPKSPIKHPLSTVEDEAENTKR